MRSQPSIAIIGAGTAGVATAVKLKRAGFTAFTVFEQSGGAGGTWYDNTYPGCEVDIHSYFYSFSFMPYDWPRTHADQPTLRRYIDDTIDHFGIRAHFQFRTKVEEAVWDEERQVYRVRLDSGEERDFTVVVSCLGLLNYPRYPDWPGLDEFEGTAFHTARWEHQHDLTDKTVAFVGTGSTASQAVPAIAPTVRKLMLFQREPGWVLPKGERDFTPAERDRWLRRPLIRKWLRYKEYRKMGRLVAGLWREGTTLNRQLRDTALAYISDQIQDPALRAKVTPDFPFGCKRTIQASTFYAALNRDNVDLVPHAVERVTPKGVVADGVEYPADVLILATGFQPQNFLASLRVVGRGGKEIHEAWGDTPRAFLGMSVPGFPNFFMIYGPNTNGGGSIIYNNERAAESVVRMVRRLARGAEAVEVRRPAYEWYVAWIDKMADKRLTAQRHCHNYYFSPSGRNVTQFPMSHLTYSLATKLLPPLGVRSIRRR